MDIEHTDELVFFVNGKKVSEIMSGHEKYVRICNQCMYSKETCNSYTMGCPPVRGDNPRASASGLSYVQVDKHGITISCHLHQCRHCTSRDISC